MTYGHLHCFTPPDCGEAGAGLFQNFLISPWYPYQRRLVLPPALFSLA